LPEGTTATELVLNRDASARKHGVVEKFVEFFGPRPRPCRSPTAPRSPNMAPAVRRHDRQLPVDEKKTLEYLASHRQKKNETESGWSIEYSREKGMCDDES